MQTWKTHNLQVSSRPVPWNFSASCEPKHWRESFKKEIGRELNGNTSSTVMSSGQTASTPYVGRQKGLQIGCSPKSAHLFDVLRIVPQVNGNFKTTRQYRVLGGGHSMKWLEKSFAETIKRLAAQLGIPILPLPASQRSLQISS